MSKKPPLAYRSQVVVIEIARILANVGEVGKDDICSRLAAAGHELAPDSVRKTADDMAAFGIVVRRKTGYELTSLGLHYVFGGVTEWPWATDLRPASDELGVSAQRFLEAAEAVQAERGGPGAEVLAELVDDVERELGGRGGPDAVAGTKAFAEIAEAYGSRQAARFVELVDAVWDEFAATRS